jgi:hypothetical protein
MKAMLEGRAVFISASFPSGDRGERFQPYDPAEIADAVTAVARAVFTVGGKLVFGGHPTITPLILFVAEEHRHLNAVDVFQSGWYEREIPPRDATPPRARARRYPLEKESRYRAGKSAMDALTHAP